MKALYYRYLFENVENGMIQAGSIYNEENDCSVNYVYLSGNPTNSNINDGVSSKDSSRTNDITGIGTLDKKNHQKTGRGTDRSCGSRRIYEGLSWHIVCTIAKIRRFRR